MSVTISERFWCKVDFGDCWGWKGAKDEHGYGYFGAPAGQSRLAHRWAYEWLVGPIPDGLVLDHLCRNTSCVNPDHVEPVLQGENVRRGRSAEVHRTRRLAMTECRHGHAYTPDNVRTDKRGRRSCVTCQRDGDRERKRAKRALLRAV